MTPLMLSFPKTFETDGWNKANTTIDLLFLTDMIVVFNTAIETEEFETIDDHKRLASEYL